MIKYGMEIEETRLPELWKIRPVQNTDYRGSYMTFFQTDLFQELTGQTIAEGNLVDNQENVFRGYHYSPHSWKLYLCLSGMLHYYLVNWDESHLEYGKWEQITLLPYQGFIKHPRYTTGMWSIGKSVLMVLQSQRYDLANPDQETITKNRLNAQLVSMGKKSIFYPDLPMVMSKRDMVGEYEFRSIHAL